MSCFHGNACLCRFQDCWSALISAAKEGHVEVVKELLENSAYIEHRDMVRAEAHGKCSLKPSQQILLELIDG